MPAAEEPAEEGVLPVRRALISVSDKRGLADLGRALAARGVEILSTGGSARSLRAAGLDVREVCEATGFPEIMDGRVKTLHPVIHGGILARRDDPAHLEAMAVHAIAPIDLVVVNLYPFAETLAAGKDRARCIENIDIGGPALIRAAAKNHEFVAVVTDPAQYEEVTAALAAGDGAIGAHLRRRLAAAAYAHTAAYDAAIAGWMSAEEGEAFPARLTLSARRAQRLRYGENPHQAAAVYRAEGGPFGAGIGIAGAEQVQGKALSYNNLGDTEAAFELVAEFQPPAFDRPAVAIIKHANPCGVALGASLAEAYAKALACDPVSAFGGIVAANRALDGAAAEAVAELFTEVVVVPEADRDARAILAEKTNLRLLVTGGLPDPAAPGLSLRSLAGGFLLQDRDAGSVSPEALKCVTKRRPSAKELADLLFAFRVAKHVKSNAIVYVRDGATVGIGAGQMSRVDSARIAAWKGREAAGTAGSVVASDAFFPFADGLMAAAEAGATAVIQPGGSRRDAEIIAAADAAGIAMVLTGLRHFRH